MNLTIYYIHATIAREFSTPTFPNPSDRPRLLFLRFLNFHLPPLWAFKKNQAPYLQSLAASLGLYKNTSPLFAITCRLFFQNMGGGGVRQIKSLQSTTSRLFFFRIADISGIPTFLGPARERPTPRPIAPEGMRGSTTRTPSGSGWRRSIAKKPGGPPGNQTRRAALP